MRFLAAVIVAVLAEASLALHAVTTDRGSVKYGSTTEETGMSAAEINRALEPKVDINKTVVEVERILDKYPELPWIERSEILSILQNITEADNEKLKVELAATLDEEKRKMNRNGSRSIVKSEKEPGSKSVMVVLPFQAEDEKDSLEELYTKNPVVMMEEQKDDVTTIATRTSTVSTTEPAFSIIEKEDKKFNPPLRIIGYRYHTTAPPGRSVEQTSTSYENLQDLEQVTRVQESSKQSNNESPDVIMKPGSVFNEIPPHRFKATENKEKFHLPENIDNFSLEDAIVGEETKSPNIDDIVFTKITTTPKIFITSEEVFSPKETTLRNFVTAMPIDTIKEDKLRNENKEEKKKNKHKATEKPAKLIRDDGLKSVIDTLPPHMIDMLKNMELKEGIKESTTTEFIPISIKKTMAAEIDPVSYSRFKPLPMKKHKTINDDMQELLKSFGLLEGNRQQKATVEEPQTQSPVNDEYLISAPIINPDMLTDAMKKTLEKLGLYNETLLNGPKNHIFNPNNPSTYQSQDEVKKLNALLSTIKKLASLNESQPVTAEFQNEILQQVKELDNITISYKSSAAINDEIHKIMKKNKGKFKIPIVLNETTSANSLKTGLDPMFFEEIQLKNEVKRQENSSTTTTSTTEPPNSPELEDSFGGGGVAPAGSDPAESLPPKRPNGLYFLLDWNTFFQVGTEDDKRRVNIRFQPKVGDGRNFLPVTIP